MREILFRAWDKTENKYKKFDGMHDTMTISREGKVEYYNLQNGSGFDEYILEQFTGLTDKNGNKIFEGDVIHVDDYDEGWNSTVEFNGGAFAVDVEGKDYDYTAIGWLEYEVEVIGNIHDNPELLEAKS